jgi:hypothetical protein
MDGSLHIWDMGGLHGMALGGLHSEELILRTEKAIALTERVHTRDIGDAQWKWNLDKAYHCLSVRLSAPRRECSWLR